jgi:hypothetical protein
MRVRCGRIGCDRYETNARPAAWRSISSSGADQTRSALDVCLTGAPRIKLYSRPENDLTARFPQIVEALARLHPIIRYLNPASQGLPQRSTLSLPFDPCAEPPLPWVKGLASALGVIPPSRPTLLLEPGYCRMSGGALPDRRVSGLVLIAIKVQYIEANG